MARSVLPQGLLGGVDTAAIYFYEVENCTGVSQEIEVELSKRIQAGDKEALQELVRQNLRFVIRVAKEYWTNNKRLPLGDLIQAGNMGLITAARRFDGAKGFKFISYAVWWIRQAILQALAEEIRTVRVPINKIGELSKLNKLEKKLSRQLGRQPTDEEILAEEKFPGGLDRLDTLREISRQEESLDIPRYDNSSATLLDYVADEAILADKVIETTDRREIILTAISKCLNEKEGRVMKRYFGLDGEKPQTLEQIGQDVGVTRERVRQIRNEAIDKLRGYFVTRGLVVAF